MRRKPGTLVPLERDILEAGLELSQQGSPDWHGFAIAREVKVREGARLLTAHGTLYKALDRMERAGLLTSHWEDPLLAAAEGRLRRRLYRVTAAGEAALAAIQAAPSSGPIRLEPGPVMP